MQMGDAVQPGETVVQHWFVPARSGPTADQGSSIMWLYHSHYDETRDTLAGLAGMIVICKAGGCDENLVPLDVDEEAFSLYEIFNENNSLFIDNNIQAAFGDEAVISHADDFYASNLKPSINGYMHCNGPKVELQTCQRVRWYVTCLGSESDVHTVDFDGQIVQEALVRDDTFMFLPSTMRTIDYIPRKAGTWIFHSNANEHQILGEQTMVNVTIGQDSSCAVPSNAGGNKRDFYIAAESVLWNYIPTSMDLCSVDANATNAKFVDLSQMLTTSLSLE